MSESGVWLRKGRLVGEGMLEVGEKRRTRCWLSVTVWRRASYL